MMAIASLTSAAASGGEVDPDRSQAFVQRFESELQDLALVVSVVRDVPGVRWIERSGDQGQALDQHLLDERRKPRGILTYGLLQNLDAEVDVPRFITRYRREASIEPTIGVAQLAHRLELEALAGQSQRRLDNYVVQRDPLDECIDVLWIVRQALGGGGEAVVEELVVALVGVGANLGQEGGQVLRVSAHHLVPPAVEEHGVPRLVDHLRGKEDLDFRRGCGPHEGRKRRRDPLLAVEEETVRPECCLLILLGCVEPVLPIEREIEVTDGPLL